MLSQVQGLSLPSRLLSRLLSRVLSFFHCYLILHFSFSSPMCRLAHFAFLTLAVLHTCIHYKYVHSPYSTSAQGPTSPLFLKTVLDHVMLFSNYEQLVQACPHFFYLHPHRFFTSSASFFCVIDEITVFPSHPLTFPLCSEWVTGNSRLLCRHLLVVFQAVRNLGEPVRFWPGMPCCLCNVFRVVLFVLMCALCAITGGLCWCVYDLYVFCAMSRVVFSDSSHLLSYFRKMQVRAQAPPKYPQLPLRVCFPL